MDDDTLAMIQENIDECGQHLYLVGGADDSPTPRFGYSIGLTDAVGAELLFAGGIVYEGDEVGEILNSIADRLRQSENAKQQFDVPGVGVFTLRPAHPSWSQLLLGALDYYEGREIQVLQVVPDTEHLTIDTPDASKEWTVESEPAWRWELEEWSLDVPETSHAAVDPAALLGAPVTRAGRWEEDYWELTAEEGTGSDEEKDAVRFVPISVLLAADPSLAVVLDLEVDEAIMRDTGGDWEPWE